MRKRTFACLLILGGCSSARTDTPQVQPSSTKPRDTDVKIAKTLEFAPSCAVIKVGETVEWWVEQGAPAVPINVTSLGTPLELFSPSLMAPLACDPSDSDTICWRHTFESAGCFTYFDTNSGNPGRPVVDDYYGTVEYVGSSGDAETGLVCVETDEHSCRGVCCNANFDCDDGYVCRERRCVSEATANESPCPADPI